MINIGLIVDGLTNVSLIFKAIMTIRYQNISGISLTTCMLFTVDVALQITYGYFTEDFLFY